MFQIGRNNYIYLFIGLLSFLLLVPIASEVNPDAKLFFAQFAFFATLIVAVWSLAASFIWYWVGWGITGVSLVFTILLSATDLAVFELGLNFCLLLFCAMSLVIVLRDVFGGEVNDNRLVGSICAYLLLGLIWAEIYFFINVLSPNSFHGLSDAKVQGFLYYSFVTLTTLGYGDILPLKPVARNFSVLEAVSGVLYLAILVARLVAAHLSQVEKPK